MSIEEFAEGLSEQILTKIYNLEEAEKIHQELDTLN